jgi:hypothetical protein
MQINTGTNPTAPSSDIGGESSISSVGTGIADLGKAGESLLKIFSSDLVQAFDNIGAQSQQIRQLFAGTEESTKNIRTAFADVVIELAKIGGTAKDAADIQLSVAKNLASNFILTKDTAIELFSASKLLGTDADKLVSTYKNIGYGFYDVSKQSVDLINTSRSLGLNASQVFATLSANIEKANTFNFQNGIEGMTKMAAQSTLLKTDMGKTLGIADKLFDPDEAIKMSSAFARLGGTVSELLDPTQLSYIARYEPEKLGELMREQASNMMRFNQETGKMEILNPGLFREVAKQAGYTTEEFFRMGSAALEFNTKMSQINFAPGATEEQKQAIAAMSQLKDGKATIEVYDENLKKLVQRDASTLTPEEMDEIMKRQAEPAKTALDIQKEANGYLKQLVDAIVTERKGIVYGTAAPLSEKTPELVNTTRSKIETTFGTTIGENRFDEISKFTREFADINKIVEKMSTAFRDIIPSFETFKEEIKKFFEVDIIDIITRMQQNPALNTIREVGNNIERTVATAPIPTISNIVPQPIQSKIEEVQTSIASLTQTNVEEKTTTEKVEGKVDLSGNIYVNVNESQLQGVLSQLFQGEEFKEMVYNSVVGMERKREIFEGTLKSFT